MKKLLILSVLLFLGITSSKAQGTAGKEFWVTFMAQDWGCYYNNNWWNADTPQLFLSSQTYANVTISSPGLNYSTTITLSPSKTEVVTLPKEVVCRYSDTVVNNGLHVESDTTINVYAVNRMWYSKGATVVIPVESIVNAPEYFVTTNLDPYNWGWTCNGKRIQSPEFTIVGIADSSVLEIVPTGASSRNSPANVPFQITLLKGETFQYMTTDNDLTGSIIRSKNREGKFSVFAGNRFTYVNRTNQGQNCGSNWDHTYEQMMPTVTWGREYTAMPYKGGKKGYILKIVAAENNTLVRVNGSVVTSLNQAEYYIHHVLSDTIAKITANNRISVAMFAVTGYYCNHRDNKPYLGDPSQVQLFPDEQMGQKATVNTVSQSNWRWWWWNNPWWQQNSPEHHINVLTRTVDTGFFTFNSNKLPDSAWSTAPNIPGYQYARIDVDSGTQNLECSKGFLAYVYGYSVLEGYAYAAAASFKPIQNNFLILDALCKKDTITFGAIENDSFANFSWHFGDGSTDTGVLVDHKYADTGWYTVKMYCRHVLTNDLESVTKAVYVQDTKIKSLFNADTAICGKVDFIVLSKDFNIDNEYRWQDNHYVYYRAIKAPGIYWLDVKERNGCIFRDSLIVTSNAIPQSNFSVSTDAFCLNRNQDLEFYNHSKSKDSVKHYRWDLGDTVIYTQDTSDIVYHRYKRANTYPILLRTETIEGCYHDTFMIVDVWPAPDANFEFTKKDTCLSSASVVLNNISVSDKNYHRRYRWRFTEGNNISNNDPPGPRYYSAAGKYQVMLIYEYTNNCNDTMIQYVNVVTDPVAAFTIPSSVYCARDTMPLNASGSQTDYNNLIYNWSYTDNSSDTGVLVKKAFNDTGNNSVRLIVESIHGCRDTVVQDIYVNETPLVDFISNSDTQCFYGHKFDFINQTKFGGGSLNYDWEISDGQSGTDSNLNNISFLSEGVYKVKLSTTTDVGCYSEKLKDVYLGTYPIAGYNINNDEQCLRFNQFDLSSTSGISSGSVTSWLWKMGNNDTFQTSKVLNYSYNNSDTFTVQLIAISNLGCMDTSKQLIVVHDQPIAIFTVNDSAQCSSNQRFILNNQSNVVNDVLSFNWSFGDGRNETKTHDTIQFANTGDYDLILEAISGFGCKDTAYARVSVDQSPASDFDFDAIEQCFLDNLFDFTNKSTIKQGVITQYHWDMGNGENYNASDITGYTYASEDTFDVRLITVSDRNCADTIIKGVPVFAQPTIKFKIDKDTQCWQKNKFVIENETEIKSGVFSSHWDFGDNTSSTQYSPDDKIYPNASASYSIKYTVISDNGCVDSTRKRIHLLERPVADFGINDSIQCFGTHLFSFNNQSSFSVMNSLNYDWDYNNGSTSHVYTPIDASYTQAGIYEVKLIAHSNITNCIDTISKYVVAAPHPNVDFEIVDDMQCFRSHLFEYNNKSSIDFGDMSYTWKLGDNSTSNSDSTTKSYALEQAYDVELVALSNYGCADSVMKTVDFDPSPIAGFAINDTAQCMNAHSFDFINNTQLLSGTYNTEWWSADGFNSSSKDINDKQFNDAGIHQIRLSVISDEGCTDTSIREVYLEKTLNSDVLLANKDSQCLKGNAFDFSTSKTNTEVNFVSYSWNFGQGTSSNLEDPASVSFSNEGEYEVELATLSANGCHDTIRYNIMVYPQPIADFDAKDVCDPEPVVFNNLSTISSGNIDLYEWDIIGEAQYSEFEPKQKFAAVGEYDVQLIVTSEDGCKDTAFKAKSAIVKLRPIADFKFEILPLSSAEETDLKFTNLSMDAVGYYWDFGNLSNSSEENPQAKYKDTGRYWVTLIATSIDGCEDTMRLSTGSLIPEFVYILPNAFSPNGDTNNDTYKGVGSSYAAHFTMEIYNRWGVKIWETHDINEAWDGTYQGQLCPQDAYLCKVQVVPYHSYIRTYSQMFNLMR